MILFPNRVQLCCCWQLKKKLIRPLTKQQKPSQSLEVIVVTLNVASMVGKGRELADMTNGSRSDIFCVQETM